MRVLLIEAEEYAEHRDREQAAADAEEPARSADEGTEDKPDYDLYDVEMRQLAGTRARARVSVCLRVDAAHFHRRNDAFYRDHVRCGAIRDVTRLRDFA
ncbi:MAG: hypothetical protein NVS3B28_01970 [Candidatus Velthaea sp.]